MNKSLFTFPNIAENPLLYSHLLYLWLCAGLEVAVELEYDWLVLDVLDEGPGNAHRHVLHVVEVEGGALAGVLERLRREGVIVPVHKAERIVK